MFIKTLLYFYIESFSDDQIECDTLNGSQSDDDDDDYENNAVIRTGFCGCTADFGGTTGFCWYIRRILLVHLTQNGTQSG